MRGIAAAILTAAFLPFSMTALSAPGAWAQTGDGILLELNAAAPSEQGGCRLTVVVTNGLPQGLERAAWQVAIFDAAGVVQSLPGLDFGQLVSGKTKVAMFELQGRPCDQIGRIIVNDVAECRADDGTDMRNPCLTGLATRALTDIEFGI